MMSQVEVKIEQSSNISSDSGSSEDIKTAVDYISLTYGSVDTERTLTNRQEFQLPIACNQCNIYFKDIPLLYRHRKMHFRSTPREKPTPVTCWACNCYFYFQKHDGEMVLTKSKQIYNDKSSESITENNSDCVCTICGEVLTSEEALSVHARNHKSTSQFPCQFCTNNQE